MSCVFELIQYISYSKNRLTGLLMVIGIYANNISITFNVKLYAKSSSFTILNSQKSKKYKKQINYNSLDLKCIILTYIARYGL